MKTIAFYNNKGGVGKTTSVVNVAATLSAFYGKKILTVDLDSQASLSDFLLEKYDTPWDERDLSAVFDGCDPSECIHSSKFTFFDRATRRHPEGVIDIIPCTPKLANYGLDGVDDVQVLKKALKKIEGYDYCLIDMPPSNSEFTYIGLAAADYFVTPCQATNATVRAMNRIGDIIMTAHKVNPSLKFVGAFLTDVDVRYSAAKWIRDNCIGCVSYFFESYTRHASSIADAEIDCIPAITITGSVGGEDYKKITAELIEKIN